MKHKKKNFLDVLKKRLFVDMKIKLFCLGLAVTMYVLISFSQLSEKTFVKKINITGLKSDLVISNNIPDSVKFIVKDKKNIIERLSEEDFSASLDLSDVDGKGSGKYNKRLIWTYPQIMRSFFSSITVNPEIIIIDIETVKEKSVSVNVPVTGNVKTGYMVKERKLTPSEVRIQGPESLIDSITTIETERIDLTDAAESFERSVKLSPVNDRIKVIGQEDIFVFYSITRRTETKSFRTRNISVNNLNQKFKYSIENLPLNITLRGSETIISAMTAEDILINIDVSNVQIPGEYNYKDFEIEVPAEVNIVNVLPRILTIKIEEKN